MSNDILINVIFDEIRVGLLENGLLVEFYVERIKESSLVGNIYKGKIVKILPGMQSAFIDVGLEKAAFLYVADIRSDVDDFSHIFDEEEESQIDTIPNKTKPDLPIEDLVQEGQEILVQVAKDPLGTKGARVTSYVTMPGRYLVLMPNLEHVGISRRITDENERENIQEKKDRISAPSLLYSDLNLIFRSVRDIMNHNIQRVIVDSKEEYDNIFDFVSTYFPRLSDRIQLYDDDEPLFDAFGVELDIARALGRRVWLKSGGYIVIDQTEAMTIVDVNTGKFVGKEDLEDTLLKTNLEAVKEIAYQIRLRNLGGIIIIDFIDMEILDNREKVFNAFVDAMKKDRAKNTIFNITELGLIQMTRKRVRESLGRTLCEPCPYCEGKGFVLSVKTICFEIFRKIKRMSIPNGAKVLITAHPDVAEFLSDEEQSALENMEKITSASIIVKGDPGRHQEKYDINILT
jgi:ribonuclease G